MAVDVRGELNMIGFGRVAFGHHLTIFVVKNNKHEKNTIIDSCDAVGGVS